MTSDIMRKSNDLRMFDWAWMLALAGLLIMCLTMFAGWFGVLTLWLGMYAIVYAVTARWLRRSIGALVAVPLTIVLLFAIPAIWAAVTEASLPKYRLPDVPAKSPIAARGHINVDTGERIGRGGKQPSLDCEAGCLALLFTPGVETVTVSSTIGRTFEQIRDGTRNLADAARTYRLVQKGTCGQREVQPDLQSNLLGLPGLAALEADWHIAQERGACLTTVATRSVFDLVIRNGVWGWPDPPYFNVAGGAPRNNFGFTSEGCNPLPPPPPDLLGFTFSEVRDASGRLLFRRQHLQANTLAAPLTWYGKGCPFDWSSSIVTFGWRPSLQENDMGGASAAGAAIVAVDLRRADRDPAMLPRFRQQIDHVLNTAEPGAGERAASLLPVYLDALQRSSPEPLDVSLVSRIILASRESDLREVRRLPGIFGDEAMASLRRAAARKLLASPAHSGASLASIWLSQPRIRFDDLYPEERELLREASQDYRAIGLIQRLPDLGPRAAPLLVDALIANAHAEVEVGREWEEGISFAERNARGTRSSMTREIEKSLCRLGPAARNEYARLREFHERTKFYDRFVHSREWDMMMYRVGGTADGIFAPSGWSGTTNDYRAGLAKGTYPSCEASAFFN